MFVNKEPHVFAVHCRCGCFCRQCNCPIPQMNQFDLSLRRWVYLVSVFITLSLYSYCNVYMAIRYIYNSNIRPKAVVYPQLNVTYEIIPANYKYPLINSTEVFMNYGEEKQTSYTWFVSLKHLFKNMDEEGPPIYSNNTPECQINTTNWGPITVNKTRLELEWVESQHLDVKLGGFYAPAQCRALYRTAILVPYRNREKNLIIFLYYLHRLFKKRLMEYRIFVIEQFGTEKWNKGTLYNIAYLETQRFGHWDCLIFHDVDLIPEDERIFYNCSNNPVHLSSAVEHHGYITPYYRIFGGVTALTPAQFESVNGYSNFYWNWGGEDDDMLIRLLQRKFLIWRSDVSIGRYASLPHERNEIGVERILFRALCRKRYRIEGLKTTNYRLISVTKRKLYTHILADVNPDKIKLDSKNLFNKLAVMNGKEMYSNYFSIR